MRIHVHRAVSLDQGHSHPDYPSGFRFDQVLRKDGAYPVGDILTVLKTATAAYGLENGSTHPQKGYTRFLGGSEGRSDQPLIKSIDAPTSTITTWLVLPIAQSSLGLPIRRGNAHGTFRTGIMNIEIWSGQLSKGRLSCFLFPQPPLWIQG